MKGERGRGVTVISVFGKIHLATTVVLRLEAAEIHEAGRPVGR